MALDNNIMDWGDTIENDGQEFVVLPEGDYTFTVTNFERGRFPGSAKIPPCNKATLTIQIDNDKGSANARFDLIAFPILISGCWNISAPPMCWVSPRRPTVAICATWAVSLIPALTNTRCHKPFEINICAR